MAVSSGVSLGFSSFHPVFEASPSLSPAQRAEQLQAAQRAFDRLLPLQQSYFSEALRAGRGDASLVRDLIALCDSPAFRSLRSETQSLFIQNLPRLPHSVRLDLIGLSHTEGFVRLGQPPAAHYQKQLTEMLTGESKLSEHARPAFFSFLAKPKYLAKEPERQLQALIQFIRVPDWMPEHPEELFEFDLKRFPPANLVEVSRRDTDTTFNTTQKVDNQGNKIPEPAEEIVVSIEGQNISIFYPKDPREAYPLEWIKELLRRTPPDLRRKIDCLVVEPCINSNVDLNGTQRRTTRGTAYANQDNQGVISLFPVFSSCNFQWSQTHFLRKFLTTVVHEVGHVASLLGFWRQSPDLRRQWASAMEKDGFYPSRYAATLPHLNDSSASQSDQEHEKPIEDFAEALTLYYAVKGTPDEARMRSVFGARFALMDEIVKSIQKSEALSTMANEAEVAKLIGSPAEQSDFLMKEGFLAFASLDARRSIDKAVRSGHLPTVKTTASLLKNPEFLLLSDALKDKTLALLADENVADEDKTLLLYLTSCRGFRGMNDGDKALFLELVAHHDTQVARDYPEFAKLLRAIVQSTPGGGYEDFKYATAPVQRAILKSFMEAQKLRAVSSKALTRSSQAFELINQSPLHPYTFNPMLPRADARRFEFQFEDGSHVMLIVPDSEQAEAQVRALMQRLAQKTSLYRQGFKTIVIEPDAPGAIDQKEYHQARFDQNVQGELHWNDPIDREGPLQSTQEDKFVRTLPSLMSAALFAKAHDAHDPQASDFVRSFANTTGVLPDDLKLYAFEKAKRGGELIANLSNPHTLNSAGQTLTPRQKRDLLEMLTAEGERSWKRHTQSLSAQQNADQNLADQNLAVNTDAAKPPVNSDRVAVAHSFNAQNDD